MQNYCKIIGAMAAVSALVAGNAQAEVEYNLHAGYSTDYVFRGVNLGTDLAETGVDVSAEVAGLNISGGVWYATYDLLGAGAIKATELDVYGQVSKDLGFATAAVGYIWYVNDAESLELADQQEAFASLSRDLGFADIALTYYWDVELDNDGYTTLALSKSYELSSCLTLNAGGTLGYLAEEGHLAHFTTKVSLDYGFAEHAKISPFVAYSWDLSDGNGVNYGPNLLGESAQNEFFYGAMLSASF